MLLQVSNGFPNREQGAFNRGARRQCAMFLVFMCTLDIRLV